MSNPLADLIPTGTSVVYAQPLTDHTVAHKVRYGPADLAAFRDMPEGPEKGRARQQTYARCSTDDSAAMPAVTAHRAYELGMAPCRTCWPTA